MTKSKADSIGGELVLSVKDSLSKILHSEIFENPVLVKQSIEQSKDFSRNLADLLWNTKDLMDHLQMLAPFDQFFTGLSDKCMIHYSKESDDEIDIRVKAPEVYSDEETKITPANIAFYISLSGELINEDCETRDKLFYLLEAYLTTKDRLELLQSTLRWYDLNFISPEFKIDKNLCESLKFLNAWIRQIIDANS